MFENGKFWLVVVISALIFLAGGLGAYLYRNQVYFPADPLVTKEMGFVVKPGESGAQIARKLFDRGLIKSPLFFRLYLRLSEAQGGVIQAGEYKLAPAMTLAQIVERMGHGTFDIKLTFVEGWRKEQYGAYLSQKLGKNFASAFLSDPQTKEGFLFPDTYFVNSKVTASQLVSLLRSNFDKKLSPKLRAGLNSQGLSLEQGVILASIVEREARFDKDRPVVAGILIKRFKNHWPLEADATTQYAKANRICLNDLSKVDCDWWGQELTAKDLALDSPFNTRKVTGLTPAPIANPGLLALQAVSFPQDSRYWYYLSDSKGRIHYAETLEQHNKNIVQYF